MQSVKKVMRIIAAGLLLFCLGFAGGYLFNRIRSTGDPGRAAADVRSYDAAAERTELAAGAVADAAGNVAEAAGELGVGIIEAGSIAGIAGDIRDGTGRALGGAGGIADGIQRIMGILDYAEKRSAEMEAACGSGLD